MPSSPKIRTIVTENPQSKTKRPTTKPLRIGLAGAGHFGQLHAAVLAQHPGVHLTAVADPSAQALERLCSRFNVQRTYGDALELIADADLDAIVIATPDEQHHHQALAALGRGRPVFVEKPLASSWAQALELERCALANQTWLQVGLLLRFDHAHSLLAQQIHSDQFGALVSIRCQRNCSQTSFATIADRVHTVFRTLIHDIDLLLWLSQARVRSVMAREYRQGEHLSPQGCFALLEMTNGCIAQLESSWYVPKLAPANVLGDRAASSIDAELAIVGSNKSAKLRWLNDGLEIWTSHQVEQPDITLWPELHGRVGGALREQMSAFINGVLAGQAPQGSNFNDALEGLRIAEAIIEAAASGAVVNL
jgi:predicted dehydrogenase